MQSNATRVRPDRNFFIILFKTWGLSNSPSSFDTLLLGENILECPNCHKELKWIPKGKHTCRCGEVIKTDGEDLKEFELSEINISFKERLTSGIKIQLSLAIFAILALFALSVFYHERILQFEADLMFKTFGIDPVSYKQAITPFIATALILVWFAYKFFRTIKK